MGVDVERMLQSIHMNFIRLTHRVPMAQVKDFPEAMQREVVGVPQAWVQLFHQLARAVVCYHDQHPPLHLRLRDLGVYFLYYRVVYFGGSKAPILYMTLMYYDVTFWILMKCFYDDRFIYIYMCVKRMFVICLWYMKQMPF